MRSFIFTALVALTAWPCFGQEVHAQMWPVATIVSTPNETKEIFLMRAASEAQKWTVETGFETCAFVATDGIRWGLKLLTLRSQVDCVFALNVSPEGMKPTKETFHTHPNMDKGGFIKLNDDTRKAMAMLGEDVRVKPTWAKVENNNKFSAHDYAAGPGYLVTQGRLLYQDGKGRKNLRDLGQVP